MGRVVIACYVPKPGRESELHDLTCSHVPRLRAAGLATDREPIIAVAADGTVVEVFEWTSEAAIAAAHTHPRVRAMWEEFDRVSRYVPIGEVAEAARLFSELEPLTTGLPTRESVMVTESLRCELFPVDLDATVAFYVDVLDFRVDRDERSSSSPYVALTRGTVRLGLAQREDAGGVGHRRPPTGVELVLEVVDLAATHDRVVAANWPIDEDLTARPWGLVDFRLLDPDGYYWRITTGASG